MFISFLLYSSIDFSQQPSVLQILLYAIGSLIVTYLIIRVLAEKYIFRKIKVIYKVISDSKDSLKDVKDYNSNNTTLENVNDVAMEWTMKTEKEISSLKSLDMTKR